MSNNPFARIVSAPASPHLEEVKAFREVVTDLLHTTCVVTVKPTSRDEILAVRMEHDYGVTCSSYLLTDGEVKVDSSDTRLQFVSGGTYTIQITEARECLAGVQVYLRPGFNAIKLQDLLETMFHQWV